MFSSSLSWVFTVVFVLTGAYSLVRLAELGSEPERTGSRVVELSHLVMSIAMVAMAWGWTGGPTSPSGLLQIVVFGFFTVWFLARAVRPTHGHSLVGEGYHLVMNAAMLFMVAAMPQIMGMDMSAGEDSGGGHHHGGGTEGMGAMPTIPTPWWATTLTWVFVVLLVAAAAWWAVRAVRADRSVAPATPDGTPPGSGGGVAVAAPAAPTRTAGPRLDAGCHLLMSLGMAGMLLAML
ncbi:DUF5134 domain-containing protein [Actinomycetospora sp. OC33-EN08]|uniref:DUF5134 domain-containing protein n=1 Tax=Actinomycetospora aurantiaca TaxID=3129233 RepID=A0ABU8MLQ3_9PSEU